MKTLLLAVTLLLVLARALAAQRASGAVPAQARIVPAFAASLSGGGTASPASRGRGVVDVAAGVPVLISVRSTEAGVPGEHERPSDVVRTAPPPAVGASSPQCARSSPRPAMPGRTITISVAVN